MENWGHKDRSYNTDKRLPANKYPLFAPVLKGEAIRLRVLVVLTGSSFLFSFQNPHFLKINIPGDALRGRKLKAVRTHTQPGKFR